jgi:hypothetical protein
MLQEKTRVPTSFQLSTDPASVEATTVKLTNTAPRHTLNLHATACPLWDKQCRTSLWSPPQIRQFLFDDIVSPADTSKTRSTASLRMTTKWNQRQEHLSQTVPETVFTPGSKQRVDCHALVSGQRLKRL